MNTQKVLLGALLVQPEFVPYVLPVLDISDFEPDLQPVFAAAQGLIHHRDSGGGYAGSHAGSPGILS